MGNKKKIIVISLIVVALLGIYFGKSYIEEGRDKTSVETNVIANLEDAKSGIPTLIMFKTDTCPYCVEMQEEISIVGNKYPGKFNVYYARLEEEKNLELAYKYGAYVVPTTVFLDKEGSEFYTHQGLMRANDIENVIKSLGV